MAEKGGSNTILYVALIFAILVALGGIGAAIRTNSDYEKLKKTIATKDQEIDSLKDNVRQKTLQRDSAVQVITGRTDGEVNLKQVQETILKDARTTLESILSEEWVTKEDIDLIRDENVKTTWEKVLDYKRNMPEFNNLYDLYLVLLNQIKAVIHLVPRLRAQRAMKIEELRQASAKFETDRIAFRTEIDELNRKYQEQQDKVLEQARQFDQQARRLTDEIERINKEKNRFEKIKKLEIAKLQSEKNDLEQRIREIIKKERKTFEASGADGEIIYADPELGFAWVNLGKNQNLRAGMTFEVFRFIKGGRKALKGKILVKTVEADMAKATIIADTEIRDPATGKVLVLPREDDPIVKGDLVRNPFFDRDEQQIFVFLGRKVANPIYKQPELERKIEEAGGKVEKTVTIRTDFVVLLQGAEEEFADEIDKAAQYGVIFMPEEELLEYLTR